MYYYYYGPELYHHGVKGMKWGVRRYQNPDGTLTEAGKRRQNKNVASNKEATIVKGTKLYRVSAQQKTDASKGKLYVSADKDTGNFYIKELGARNIYKKGEAFVHEYISSKDLKMPSKGVMEKIELGLLKDKEIQSELVDSLMKKGLSREQATEQVRPYSVGKAFVEKIGDVALGAYMGAIAGAYPAAMAGKITGLPGVIGAVGTGAVAGGIAGGVAPSEERRRALGVARVSYGDVNNKKMNAKLQKALSDKGYNAMKDYNDRRAYGDRGKQAVIVFDSKNNVKLGKSKKVTARDYGEAYAKSYMKEHPKSKLDYNDLVKDGEKAYKSYYEKGVINRARSKENEEILDREKRNRKKIKL